MIRLYHREKEKSTLWHEKTDDFYNRLESSRSARICIEITFKEKILSGINGPGLWDREYIILGTERVAALSVYFPDFQDWKTLPVKGMVGMEDRYGS